jgi:hypothetical protein
MSPTPRRVRFYYEPVVEALDGFVADLEVPAAARALAKLKFAVLGSAWVDHHISDPDVASEDALAWAWEDLDIALAGFGDACLTGVIAALWAAVPKARWPELQEQVNRGRARAEAATPASVPRRYLHAYRKQGVRTPADGFDLPVLVPTQGPRLREWAVAGEHDPGELEQQLKWIEECERMGLVDLGDEITVFRTLSDGQRESGGATLADRVVRSPFALDKAGVPHLRLVEEGEAEPFGP